MAPFLLPLLLALSPARAPATSQEEVQAVLERLRAEDPAERRKALDELIGRGAEAVPAALRALEGGPGDLRERVGVLVRQLSSAKWKERDEAGRGLVRLGRAARPVLQEHQETADPEVGWRVRAALAEIRERESRDEELELARGRALCEFLGEAGDARAIRPLLGVMAAGAPALRLGAAEALGLLRGRMEAAQAEETAERVLEALSDPAHPLEGAEKARFIRVLCRLRSAACVRPLAALLADRSEKNVHVKRLAMTALAAAGGAPALRSLVEALGSEEVYLRQGAGALLGELAGEGFGYDPRGSPSSIREAVQKYRAWWSRKFGKEWED